MEPAGTIPSHAKKKEPNGTKEFEVASKTTADMIADLANYGDTLTRQEIAKVRATSDDTAKKWIQRRELKPVERQLDGRFLYDKADVEAALRMDTGPGNRTNHPRKPVDEGK